MYLCIYIETAKLRVQDPDHADQKDIHYSDANVVESDRPRYFCL